jgi:hypothetical protein
MKKVLITIGLAAFVSGATAQGLINFLNSSASLYTVDGAARADTAGTFTFALFTAPVGTVDPTAFNLAGGGVYAANQAVAGRLFGGVGVAVSGWAPGATQAFLVRGWSSDQGTTWAEVSAYYNAGSWTGPGYYGETPIAPGGVAGGFDGTGNLPNLNLFGGTQGLAAGPNLTIVPEPTSIVLAGLGAASLLMFRRRK